MGGKAIIATGENASTEVKLKNSMIPEAEQIKDRGVNFIDKDDKAETDDTTAFIDDSEEDDVDFLEF